MTKTIAFGDLHLARETPARVAEDFVRLVRSNPGARLLSAGDLFDLSADFPGQRPLEAIRSALEAQPALTAALGEHVDRGGELWMVAGNHDAAIGEPDARPVLLEALKVRGDAALRVRTSPWFIRHDGLHLEHGHLYDPDNAPSHPLYPCVRSLGVHFVEQFIAPTGAFRYLNANDETPLKLLLSAFRWYGVRGPYVVYRYFHTAFDALTRSGPLFEAEPGLRAGRARAPGFASEQGIAPELLDALTALAARPTMTSLNATFQRLYLDRVAATVTLMAGCALLAAGKRREAIYALGAGALAMGTSWALGHDRYGGAVPEQLDRAALEVREVSRSHLVVFGHAHREALRDGYANTASFAFPRGTPGRPFLEIDGPSAAPRAAIRHLLPEA
jgi:hypothetical protein